ncbi:MAG: acyl-coenzyme A synthetase/AMP-(fatty) acid ligase [Neolewinella sp.]|jgi:acyl-coenzyme A synthetase/AMP-(fatty) acid ligase
MCIHNNEYGRGHITTGQYWLDLNETDLHWNISDTGWAKAAWSSYFGPWLLGAGLFVYDAPGFDAKASLEMFRRYPITTFCGAPTIYRLFVQNDLSGLKNISLRHCVGAGEPLNPEVIDVWQKATDLVIRDGYGQTETTILCGNSISAEPRFGSMGKPAPGIDLQVIDENGRVMPPNQEGDIAVNTYPQRPLGLFKEYKGEPEKTARSYRGQWYLTGDRAYVDEDGYFWFVGRDDDVIISAGYRIGPFEVESVLLEHPAVAESAVVSSPDDERGAVVKAFIVLASGYTASDDLTVEIQQFVKQHTAPYKYPRKVEFVQELPKTVSGKIRRVELRESEY